MRISTRALTTGASFAALIAAAPFIAGERAEQAIRTGLAEHGARAASIAVSPAGAVRIGDLRFATGGMTVVVGAVTHRVDVAGLFGSALAQASGYSFDNVTAMVGPVTIDIPKIVVEGASFSKDEIAALFAFDAGLPQRLRTLNARSITIPEIKVAFAIPNSNDSMTYEMRNVAIDGVVNGRVGRVSAGSTRYGGKMKEGAQQGEILKTEIRGLDMVQAARVYFETASADERPATIYESYSGDGFRSSVQSAAAIEMEMGKFSAGAMRGRPMQTKSLAASVLELLAVAEKQRSAGMAEKDPQDALRIFGIVEELIGAFEDDGMTGENWKVFVGEKAKPVATVSIAKVEGSYGGGKMAGGFRINGVDVKAPDVTARLAHFGVEGFSYAPMFKGMAAAIRAGDVNFKQTDPRTLMPTFGTTTIRGLEIDAPDPSAPKGIKPERVSLKLGSFLIGAKDQIKGVPTSIDFALDNLAVKLPQNSSEKGIQTLKALGYTALDVSARLGLKWNEQTNEIVIPEISVSGVNMGRARLSGTIGNVGREVFEGDLSTAQVALMGATAKAVSLQVDNAGLGEKAFAFQARSQNRKPDDLRKELGMMAQMGIPAVLGPSDEAKALAGALSKFVTTLKSLRIDVKAKNAGGVGLPDIVTIGTPDKALGLVNVSASAE